MGLKNNDLLAYVYMHIDNLSNNACILDLILKVNLYQTPGLLSCLIDGFLHIYKFGYTEEMGQFIDSIHNTLATNLKKKTFRLTDETIQLRNDWSRISNTSISAIIPEKQKLKTSKPLS